MPLDFEDTITTDVGKRLEELFGLADANVGKENRADSDLHETLFDRLEGVVDAADREMTEYLMGRFRECVDQLKDALREDKILFMFVRLIDSVGEYIADHGLQKDPGALELLKDVCLTARRAAFSKSISFKDKKRILYNRIMRYKRLKEKMGNPPSNSEADVGPVPERTGVAGEKAVPPGVRRDEMSKMSPHEAFVLALEEIRNVLSAEFSALRTELTLWRKGQ